MPSEAGGGVRGVAVRRCPQKDSPSAFRLQHPEDPAPIFSLSPDLSLTCKIRLSYTPFQKAMPYQ